MDLAVKHPEAVRGGRGRQEGRGEGVMDREKKRERQRESEGIEKERKVGRRDGGT